MIKDPPGTKTMPYGFSGKNLFPLTPTSSPLDLLRLPLEPQLMKMDRTTKNVKNFFILLFLKKKRRKLTHINLNYQKTFFIK